MACCSEINKNRQKKTAQNPLDYIFKAAFVVVTFPFIAVIFPFKFIFMRADVYYSSALNFSRKFTADIHQAITGLNALKINCRFTAFLHTFSPALAGFIYRNFGYIFVFCAVLILSFGGSYLWHLIFRQ